MYLADAFFLNLHCIHGMHFISSFILGNKPHVIGAVLYSLKFKFNFIYIAHLKTTMVDQSASQYPEKLPRKQNEYSKTSQCLNSITQIKAKQYRCVLRNDLKIPTLWAVLMCAGKPFHKLGATTEKARSPLFFNLALRAPDWTTSVL